MNDFFEIMEKYGKLIAAIKKEKLTKWEIADKHIPGINKNNVAEIVRSAIEEGVLLKEDGDTERYALNTAVFSQSFSEEFTDPVHETTPEDYGLPPLSPTEERQIGELETEIEGLTDKLDAYETLTGNLQAEVDKLRSENESLKAASGDSPAPSSEELLASINETIDKKMGAVITTFLSTVSSIQSVSQADDEARERVREQEEEIAGYKDKIASLEKKVHNLGTGNLPEIRRKWKEIKKSLYGDMTLAMPGGVVEAIDEQTGEIIKKEGTATVIPYFPGKPHACEANRPAFFSFPENMTKDGLYKENIEKTQGVFSSMTSLHRKAAQAAPKDREKVMASGQEQLVIDLLNNPNLNDIQKISQYSVIRTLNSEYFHLLLVAVQNGLKASNIIAFLEEPTELFNMEIVRNWASLAMNEKNSDLRLEVARDLIDRRWSIRNGEDEYVLYSKKEIDDLKALLDIAMTPAAKETPIQEEPAQEDTAPEEPSYSDVDIEEDPFPFGRPDEDD
ncbi:MAG: hypothetical protein IJI65_01055 [Lachnospiraceae bacterium]|nr:hypothetical protein [Lachnospiraceae bacterium]